MAMPYNHRRCHMAPQATRLEGLLTVEFEHKPLLFAFVRYKSYNYGTLSMSLTSVSPQLSETSEGSFE